MGPTRPPRSVDRRRIFFFDMASRSGRGGRVWVVNLEAYIRKWLYMTHRLREANEHKRAEPRKKPPEDARD